MMAEMDASYLFATLESNDSERAEDVKNLLHETLSANPKDAWLVNGLIDYYLNTSSPRGFEILTELREPHDRHLFDKLAECIKNSPTRVITLSLFGRIICKQPSWLYKVANHSLLTVLLKILKTDNDVHTLLIALLCLINLLPVIPALISSYLMNVFEIFSRLAAWHINKSANIPEIYTLHLDVGVYSLFHRLYGMYPCNFLSYLRSHYGNRENLDVFAKIIRPMLDRVRMHPLLVTASKESEVSTNRWKQMETHAIIMECAKVSLDIVEGINNDFAAYQYNQQVRPTSSELPSENVLTKFLQMSNLISMDSHALLTTRNQETTSTWSPSNVNLGTVPLEVKELSSSSFSSLTSSRLFPLTVEAIPNQSESQPSSPLRKINSPVKFAAFTDDTVIKKDSQKQSTAVRALQFHETSSEEKTTSGKFLHSRSSEYDIDDRYDVDKEVCELVGRGKFNVGGLEDSGKEEFSAKLYQRSDSVIHDEAEGIQEDYDECSNTNFSQVVEFAQNVSRRFRYYSQCGTAPDISELKPVKPKIKRSHSCPTIYKPKHLMTEEISSNQINEVAQDVSNRNDEHPGAVANDNRIVADGGQASHCIVDQPQPTQCSVHYELILRALPMMAPTCCFQCQNCMDLGAVSKEYSPAELLDRHISYGSDVYAKQFLIPASRGVCSSSHDAIAKGQIYLLHNQLLFERHRRSLHSERNRHLLAKLKKISMAEEQIIATKDQLKYQEKNIQDITQNYHQLAKEKLKELLDQLETMESLASENRNLKAQVVDLKSDNNKLQAAVVERDQQNFEILRELKSNQADLHMKSMEVQNLELKLAENNKVQTELDRVKKELLLLGELQQKYREKLLSLAHPSAGKQEAFILMENYKYELNSLKQQLEQRTQQADNLKGRLTEGESQQKQKEIALNEQKSLFHKMKEKYEERVQKLEKTKQESDVLISRLVAYIQLLTMNQSDSQNNDHFGEMSQLIESLGSTESCLEALNSDVATMRRWERGDVNYDSLDAETKDYLMKHLETRATLKPCLKPLEKQLSDP